MRSTAALSVGLIVAGASGCASRVATGTGGTTLVSPFLTSAVEFDHGCKQDRLAVLRKAGAQADLDVCGTVRRYKLVFSDANGQTWVDVTSLYPASSLPQPRADRQGAAPAEATASRD